MWRFFLILFVCSLSACASTKNNLDILQINSLASANSNDGHFKGLEALADSANAETTKRINIFYLHGIGRTEDPSEPPLGRTFMRGVANAYDLEIAGNTLASRCGVKTEGEMEMRGEFIEITAGETVTYHTVVPGVQLSLDRLVCMDRQTLKVKPDLEYVVYRIFWDEFFWNSIQMAHVGQDDNEGDVTTLADLRRKYNRRLKDQMVNFGFSDAIMYLGPAGQQIRDAIRGAMCSAALDAEGYSFEKQGNSISAQRACTQATDQYGQANQFAFISESLGSKITFDLMREALTDGRKTIIDKMIAGSEIYMMANQLALLSLGDLSKGPVSAAYNDPSSPRPKIVALSEVNDFLTYEINPFFENLWALRNGAPKNSKLDTATRATISQTLGFDFVDIRVEFADPIVSVFKDFVDPLQAHAKHVAEPGIIELMLCGAQSGEIRESGCDAGQENDIEQKDKKS